MSTRDTEHALIMMLGEAQILDGKWHYLACADDRLFHSRSMARSTTENSFCNFISPFRIRNNFKEKIHVRLIAYRRNVKLLIWIKT